MKYFTEVIQQLVTANDQLIAGENNMTIIKAKQIAQNTQVIINAAKVMADFGRFTKTQPEFLKEPEPELTSTGMPIIIGEGRTGEEPEAGSQKSEAEEPEVMEAEEPEAQVAEEPEVKTNAYPVDHGGTGTKPPNQPFSTMYLKGCCNISETQAELFLQWLHKQKIYTIPQLDNKCLEYYNDWVKEGTNKSI